MKLTDVNIKKAKPGEKTRKLFDGGGLYIQIEPSGGKLWRYKYRFDGKYKLLALGKYPDVSLADVRERHLEARKQLAQGGIDPARRRKRPKKRLERNGRQTLLKLSRSSGFKYGKPTKPKAITAKSLPGWKRTCFLTSAKDRLRKYPRRKCWPYASLSLIWSLRPGRPPLYFFAFGGVSVLSMR